jgi:hypothetical protein
MKSLFAFLILVVCSIKADAQLFTFTFSGTGTCPTQGSTLSSMPSNVTVSAVSRVGTLTCSATTDYFNTIGWSTSSSIDPSQYIELSLTAASGYVINLNSISFSGYRSSTGPANGRIYHDGGNGTFTELSNFSLGTTLASIPWDFADFSSTTAGTVKFRIFGWGAGGSTGTFRIDDLALYATVTAASSNPIIINNTTGNVGIGITPSADARLYVNGNIFTNAKIAIGTTDPLKIANYALAVNGEAIFNKARVNIYNAWPDFVFNENYDLLNLNSLEQYIKKYNHLPNIPSAEEVKQKGIDVGETQASLLQKIEELTLYIIEQNKMIKIQEDQIKKIQNQIEMLNNK